MATASRREGRPQRQAGAGCTASEEPTLKPEELEYTALSARLTPYTLKGRTESATFLSWFLENVYRLDDVQADDAVCDAFNDKGVDGLIVDDLAEQIIVFQSKLRQKAASTLGDSDLKAFAGALTQFQSAESIQKLLDSNATDDLKQLLRRHNVQSLIAKGFSVKGVFVTNQVADRNAREFLQHREDIELYDRDRIVAEYLDIDAAAVVEAQADFSLSDFEPLVYSLGDRARMFLLPVAANELIQLKGISDGTLFAQNVRLTLGNTKVNKDIAATMGNPEEHLSFPLFHNGITLLCDHASIEDHKLTVNRYVVVNGAQSLTVLYNERKKITADLRLLVRVIEVHGDATLSEKITSRSNNQNAVKPRDSKSNSLVQLRLQKEFAEIPGARYFFEVKRGEVAPAGAEVISNEEAGRLLLAFDREQPWSSHQLYRIFDDDYSVIFGRKEVNAKRIIMLALMMERIKDKLSRIESRPFASYALTRFMLLYALRRVMDAEERTAAIVQDPGLVMDDDKRREDFVKAIDGVLEGLMVDLNYELKDGKMAQYKSDLKSEQKVLALVNDLMRSYEKDTARGRVVRLADATFEA